MAMFEVFGGSVREVTPEENSRRAAQHGNTSAVSDKKRAASFNVNGFKRDCDSLSEVEVDFDECMTVAVLVNPTVAYSVLQQTESLILYAARKSHYAIQKADRERLYPSLSQHAQLSAELVL